jgi:mono/diheme cytochrome c family protein
MHLSISRSIAVRKVVPALAIALAGFLVVLGLGRALAADETESDKAKKAEKAEKAEAAEKGQGQGQDKDHGHSDWEAPAEAKWVKNPIPAGDESYARGLAIYTKACASCHGAEGKGDGKSAKLLAEKPADLRKHVPHHTDGELFWKITQGKKPMPSFKKDLKDEQRWDVVNYLRKLVPSKAVADSMRAAATSAPKEPMIEPESPQAPQAPSGGRGGY